MHQYYVDHKWKTNKILSDLFFHKIKIDQGKMPFDVVGKTLYDALIFVVSPHMSIKYSYHQVIMVTIFTFYVYGDQFGTKLITFFVMNYNPC